MPPVNRPLRKFVSVLIVVVLVLNSFPVLGPVKSALATASQDLQALVDTTPAGGTLNLTNDYIGKRDSWGKNENVTIKKAITITGPSGSSVKIDNIRLKVEAANVTLQNLRFEEGDNYYGAIHSWDKGAHHLTVRNCVFNYEKDKNWLGEKRVPWMGKAAYLVGCNNATFENCTFKYCEAEQDGGAVYLENANNCRFISCTFENNRATSKKSQGGTGVGGAVYVKSSNGVSLQGCTFRYNFAEQYGGAVFIKKCKNISVTDCTFTQNDSTPSYAIVEGPYGMGAALAINDSDSATLTGCSFHSNTAYMGAGIFAAGSDLTVNSCGFYSNEVERKATVNPSVIRTALEISMTFIVTSPGTIIELLLNYALTAATCPAEFASEYAQGTGKIGGEGGGIYAINSILKVNSSTFSGNKAEKLGGGIYAAGSEAKTTEIKNSTFQTNTAGSGGGAIANMMPGMVVDNCTINNNAAEAGGGLYSVTGCTVKGTTFTSNTASLGGAVCANTINNEQVYRNCTFNNNRAKSGGAIYAHGSSKDGKNKGVPVSSCRVKLEGTTTISNNTALNSGGGLSLYYITARLDNVTFTKNTAGAKGGAIYNENLCDTLASWCEFTENKSNRGGFAFNSRSALDLPYGKFHNNEGDTGAGVIHDESGYITLANGLFTGNQTKNRLTTNGSILYLNGTVGCKVTNCTMVNNMPPGEAPNDMSAIYLRSGAKLTLRNNIILSNTMPENVSGKDITVGSGCTVDAKYNMCALPGTGNITGTIDVLDRNYRPRYDFMWGYLGAMEAGTRDIDTYPYDLDKNTRVIDNDGDGVWAIDLGCYEQQYVRLTFGIDGGAARGKISGDTVQWIPRGTKPDLSAVTITPAAGFEFDHWKTAGGVVFDEKAVFYYGRSVYAVMAPKKIKVTFEYDPAKLKVASAGSGSKVIINPNTHQFITYAPFNTAPAYPTLQGIDGWQFNAWSSAPAPVTADTVITASAKPTATYLFGKRGYYDQDGKTGTWTTDLCNPLQAPQAANIVVSPGYEFTGWSDTPGGATAALPASITEPRTFYAVYQAKQFFLSVNLDEKGTFTKNPSGSYDYGTRLNLTDEVVLDFAPQAGWYCTGFGVGGGANINITALTLTGNMNITARYAAKPGGKLVILTNSLNGIIDYDAAIAMGFSGNPLERVEKTNPDGSENPLALIRPLPHTGFAGFMVQEIDSDLYLTALYTNPFYWFGLFR